MAKDKSADRQEKKERKEKKREKRAEENGVSKSSKDKKSKKHEKLDAVIESADSATAVLNKLEESAPGSVTVNGDDVSISVSKGADGDSRVSTKKPALVGAMVPFANPLADEKTMKKVLKGVKKSAQSKTLKRGVKEVVKALRKSPTTSSSPPQALVVLAADISPFDVISHIPVLCEDHHVPYLYVPSRAELGAAGSTKRPTSVVMITPQEPKKKEGAKADKSDDKESWTEVYADLSKAVIKAGRDVRI